MSTEKKITIENKQLNVPNNPTIPFIEGDGIGQDIWKAAQPVFEAAVKKAYGDKKKITWMEVYAGEKANKLTGEWLPAETIKAFRTYLVGIKGPLTTPIGKGFRSLNVALRQELDLFACVRPVVHFHGVPSPVKHPENIDMIIFRENSEDIYSGIEFEAESEDAKKLIDFLHNQLKSKKMRFPNTSGIGIKPISQEGTARIVRAAIQYALSKKKDSVTLVHKGNIMKYTEGGFRKWGFEIAKNEFGATDYQNGPWQKIERDGHTVIIKDVIADAFLQQILLRPKEYDVITTMNLNGDYISDALAAQVGGIGIAPGANINYDTGIGIFEATHGTAPSYAGLDKVNPGSVILSGEMMLRYLGWNEAADLIIKGIKGAIGKKKVTYDFHRLMPEATLVKCSEFGMEVIKNM